MLSLPDGQDAGHASSRNALCQIAPINVNRGSAPCLPPSPSPPPSPEGETKGGRGGGGSCVCVWSKAASSQAGCCLAQVRPLEEVLSWAWGSMHGKRIAIHAWQKGMSCIPGDSPSGHVVTPARGNVRWWWCVGDAHAGRGWLRSGRAKGSGPPARACGPPAAPGYRCALLSFLPDAVAGLQRSGAAPPPGKPCTTGGCTPWLGGAGVRGLG